MLSVDRWRRWWWSNRGKFAFPATSERPVKSPFSATLFWGDTAAWDRYLRMTRAERYDGTLQAQIHLHPSERQLLLRPGNEVSVPVVQQLNRGWQNLREQLQLKPFVLDRLDGMLFDNSITSVDHLWLRSSKGVPSEATRESHLGDRGSVFVVFQSGWVDEVMSRITASRAEVAPLVQLGMIWPLLRRLLSQLSYPATPRDRFLEKIDLSSPLLLVAANLLYHGSSRGRLQPNAAGVVYEQYLSERSGVPVESLSTDHPYCRLLHQLATILFDESAYRENECLVKVMIREDLDERYLRLSVAGIMPGVTESMAAMPYRYRKGERQIVTPLPAEGRYGILNREDLDAWQAVEWPFREMGFVLLSQLGMGEFGRVYEALNLHQPHLPPRVALKVDRITEHVTKTIQAAETAMEIGRDLAQSPHIIRLYDAGQLKRQQLTYHILQLVNGDTLDNLVGVTGHEHSSVMMNRRAATEDELRKGYEESIRRSVSETWRRARLRHSFTEPLTLSQTMDLQTSIFLWVEKVHAMGYAINDLKNGNLMVSRRGQLKGIDLDAYSRTDSPIDKLSDFLFLSTSLLLYLLHVSGQNQATALTVERMLRSRDALRQGMEESWAFEEVGKLSHGRVQNDDVIELLVDLITRCRTRSYLDDPSCFTDDIDRWIRLKRTIFAEELVLD